MKIFVINLSGNVGKTALAVHLLAAFRPEAKFISVESYNSSAADDVESLQVEELAASRFKEIYREIMLHDDVIVDVGSSNVGQFMTEITRFKSAVGEFDMVLVPTVPADKQQRDTIATIEWLHKLGIDGRKIRVVFNQYDSSTLEPIEVTYAQVIGYSQTEGRGRAVYEPHAIVASLEIYDRIKSTGRTIKELAEDPTDWRAARKAAKEAGNIEQLENLMDAQMSHDLAVSALDNLAAVNGLLFPKSTAAAPAKDKGAKK